MESRRSANILYTCSLDALRCLMAFLHAGRFMRLCACAVQLGSCIQMPCVAPKTYPGWCVQYMKWAGIPASAEDTFWTNPTVRNLIKNDYKVLVTRKNTFNGKLYGEDNTIFAWDIYNVCASYTCLLPPHSHVYLA